MDKAQLDAIWARVEALDMLELSRCKLDFSVILDWDEDETIIVSARYLSPLMAEKVAKSIFEAPTDIRTLLDAVDERDTRIAELEAALGDILIALSDDNLNPDDDSGDYQMSMINEAHDIARKARGE
jgi:hypothetical protein